jgi:hypothetical protein
MDVMDITDDATTARISARYESRLIDLDRSRQRRYTPEDQTLNVPGDLGFEYVAGLQDMQIFWGRLTAEAQTQIRQWESSFPPIPWESGD